MRVVFFFFFSSRRRHTRLQGDWSSDVCSSDLLRDQERRARAPVPGRRHHGRLARLPHERRRGGLGFPSLPDPELRQGAADADQEARQRGPDDAQPGQARGRPMMRTTDLARAAEQALELVRTEPGVLEAEVFAAANTALLARLNYTSHIPSNGVEEPK